MKKIDTDNWNTEGSYEHEGKYQALVYEKDCSHDRGGDCPGLNAVIRSVVRLGLKHMT